MCVCVFGWLGLFFWMGVGEKRGRESEFVSDVKGRDTTIDKKTETARERERGNEIYKQKCLTLLN